MQELTDDNWKDLGIKQEDYERWQKRAEQVGAIKIIVFKSQTGGYHASFPLNDMEVESNSIGIRGLSCEVKGCLYPLHCKK
ncbi:MAG: hypothetical protein WC662_01415 [Candidatus Paceibacterota bacterium]|jgi:hypothetical protein